MGRELRILHKAGYIQRAELKGLSQMLHVPDICLEVQGSCNRILTGTSNPAITMLGDLGGL